MEEVIGSSPIGSTGTIFAVDCRMIMVRIFTTKARVRGVHIFDRILRNNLCIFEMSGSVLGRFRMADAMIQY